MKKLNYRKVFIIIAILAFTIAITAFSNLYQSKDKLAIRQKLSISKKKITSKDSSKNSLKVMDDFNLINRKVDFIYPTDGIRDPFQRKSQTTVNPQLQKPVMPMANPSSFMLFGILWNDKNPIAIIKDSKNETHLAKVGEKIDSFRVIDIKPGMVKVERDNKVIQLELWPEAKM
jgi:hypothetical protein